VQEFVRVWIDGNEQPKLLAIDSDHRLVERNVIRAGIVSRLQTGFPRPFDIELLNFPSCIQK